MEFRHRPHETVLLQKKLAYLATEKHLTLFECLGRGFLLEMRTEGLGDRWWVLLQV